MEKCSLSATKSRNQHVNMCCNEPVCCSYACNEATLLKTSWAGRKHEAPPSVQWFPSGSHSGLKSWRLWNAREPVSVRSPVCSQAVIFYISSKLFFFSVVWLIHGNNSRLMTHWHSDQPNHVRHFTRQRCGVSREQLWGWAHITMRKHLWFMAVWDASVLTTPRLKWLQNKSNHSHKKEEKTS